MLAGISCLRWCNGTYTPRLAHQQEAGKTMRDGSKPNHFNPRVFSQPKTIEEGCVVQCLYAPVEYVRSS